MDGLRSRRGWTWFIGLTAAAWILFLAAPETTDLTLARSWRIAGFGLLAIAVSSWLSPPPLSDAEPSEAPASALARVLLWIGYALVVLAVVLKLLA